MNLEAMYGLASFQNQLEVEGDLALACADVNVRTTHKAPLLQN
jgi:hypothetical protein